MFFKKKEISNNIKTIRTIENGFSIVDLSIAITIIGFLAVIVIPNFSPALEFVEVLVAEKYLLKSVRECQSGLIKNDLSTQYDLPVNNSGLRIFKNNKYLFSYTGNPGECINLSTLKENRIRVTRSNISQNLEYSLIINLVSGEKTSEGQLPGWLDWWEGVYSPIIPENDPLLDEFT